MGITKKDLDNEASEKLIEYVGYYDSSPWWGETYISTFNGKLVSLGLPSEEPAESMTFYKHVDGDIFRRVRKDKTLGETLTFMRDQDGKIIKIERHGNFSSKIIR